MPPKAAGVAKKAKPWPGYFLVRTNGEVIPLITLDELPPGIEIVGVPRCLELEATVGMLNLGLQRSSGSFYKMVDHHDDENEADAITRPNTPQTPTPPSTPTRREAQHHACTSPSLAKSSHNPANSKGTVVSRPETQICRHWCTHGICKWGQQCRYRHIMPMTLPGLQEVGLSDWPTWYRSLNPGYFVSESMKRQKERLNGEVMRPTNRMIEDARSAARLKVTGDGRGERLRANMRSRAPPMKREDLGEQIIARLRGMSGALKVEQVEKMIATRKAAGSNTPSALIERAAARDTKDWEEESGVAGDDKDSDVSVGTNPKAEMAKGKLVDV